MFPSTAVFTSGVEGFRLTAGVANSPDGCLKANEGMKTVLLHDGSSNRNNTIRRKNDGNVAFMIFFRVTVSLLCCCALLHDVILKRSHYS